MSTLALHRTPKQNAAPGNQNDRAPKPIIVSESFSATKHNADTKTDEKIWYRFRDREKAKKIGTGKGRSKSSIRFKNWGEDSSKFGSFFCWSVSLWDPIAWEQDCQGISNELRETMFGQFKSTVSCENCEADSVRFESFLAMSVSLGDLFLENFFNEEIIEDVLCSSCNVRGKKRKQMAVNKFPKILVVHLKRFEFKFDREMSKYCILKDETLQDFPIDLVLEQNKKYSLSAIINHYGSVKLGHYTGKSTARTLVVWWTTNLKIFTAFCKSSGYWNEFNDANVQRRSIPSIVTPGAYILFYEKQN